ncbi:CRISPR-associated RAMP protein [Candidatus Bathyarchaeota archaeon]|nr:CRISPR-associated RAMP protein [Candidatus Bathyarchaeota archaeon]
MVYGDFDRFKVKYLINLELINETPLSIGMGRTLWGAVDNPVVKRDGVPYIPGSTLKGVLRVEAESYARTIYGVDEVCDVLDPTGPHGEERRLQELGEERYEPCVVCKIFGGPTIASHLTIYDAYPISDYHIEVRRRVSISRLTEGQYPGKLFEVEQVDPKTSWNLRMDVENIDLMSLEAQDNEQPKQIINYLMNKILTDGLNLGGKRSIGLGLVKARLKNVLKITIKDEKYYKEDVTDAYKEMLGVK